MKCNLFESTHIISDKGVTIPRSQYVVLSTYDFSTGKCVPSLRFNGYSHDYSEEELLEKGFYPANN